MTTKTSRTWCGICEAACGLIATVDDGRLTSVTPDPEHPVSQGFACAKGMAWPDVLADPDRVTEPLRRQPDGSFQTVSWDAALAEIGARLRDIIATHGGESVGLVEGNPTGANYGTFMAAMGMAHTLKTKHFYSASSVDINNYFVASHMLYGHSLITVLPDFVRTDLALVIGSNPVVSHGSMATLGRVQDHLHQLRERGGRLIVVDPRRTETAELGEHVPIRPGADPWFLLGLLKVVLASGTVDRPAVSQSVRGLDFLDLMVAGIELDRCAAESGIDVERIEEIGHTLTTAASAVIYGRCGASLGRFSTLTKYLLDVLAIVTGNLDRPGGMLFGAPFLDAEGLTALLRVDGHGRWRTRVDDLPEVMGQAPLATLAREITTPGKGQLRALLSIAANITMSAPGSGHTHAALSKLDLFVSIDPYVTDTNRVADFILPPTLLMERDGFPLLSQLYSAIPTAQWTAAIVDPPVSARDDAWIIDQICQSINMVPAVVPGAQLLGRLGIRLPVALACDLAIRTGRYGDLFGLRRNGLSRRKLMADGAPRQYAAHPPVGVLRRRVRHRDRRVHLDQPTMAAEVDRLIAQPHESAPGFPLRLFTIRELRSHNSWLHNIPKLMSAGRNHRLRINPKDADDRGIATGSMVVVRSPWGQVTTLADVTDEVVAGSVGMPASWGHAGGWRRAVQAGGGNYNELVPNDPVMIDRVSGNAFLNGIDVEVAPVTDLYPADLS